jgi:hypothetical protein
MNEQTKPDKRAGRGRDTLFRVTVRHQTDLIQIADNKANMIITVNALVISSVIAAIGYGVAAGRLLEYGPLLILPIALVLVACLSSLVVAILAARPRLIRSAPGTAVAPGKASLFFFEEIARHSQADYVAKIKGMIGNEEEIYDNLAIDIYNQGRVLKRKYRLLVRAYQILMFGFIFTVGAFLLFLVAQLF